MRLIVFDVDGTLVDSQGIIVAAMNRAFEACDLPRPAPERVRRQIGLSLDGVMAALAHDQSAGERAALVAAYRTAFFQLRAEGGAAAQPLFAGAMACLDGLDQPETLLGVATGKSRRGLDSMIAMHGLEGRFVTRQTADDHPSKPHPSMLWSALEDTGADPRATVMIGDTSYDMDMARAAGVAAIGVTWGNHDPHALRRAGAMALVDRFEDLGPTIDTLMETQLA